MTAVPTGYVQSRRVATCTSTRTRSYPIDVVPAIADAARLLARRAAGRDVWLVADSTVQSLHGGSLLHQLAECGTTAHSMAIPAGEGSKTMASVERIIEWLCATGFSRRDLLVGFGGGVVIDTAGLVASIFMRGVPYLNLPTTLLGQVDAAIGAKVGVDHGSAKNLLGAFYEPQAVISCVEFLGTLPVREVRSGLAEVVKKAVIASADLFDYLVERHAALLDPAGDALSEVIGRASALKSELISADPYEDDLRRPLNFGHTVGHALETATGYGPVRHGEAVAFGMSVAVQVALGRGALDPAEADRIVGLLRVLGLPTALVDLAAQPVLGELLGCLDKIRQVRDGSLRFVLPTRIGATRIVDDVTTAELRAAISLAGTR
ncbi:MAG TPA: 3-dehydroquinate synthase family protein [Jatrophihabitans sp.]|nr:3-dehydroquinate synthase family protein [Jatrophihabitans sp.]